ncbi:hypothetical protein [Butyrivibrio sp. YAB3001]|uniref:hypothetical protein n=1 Tax=Butyrivibrio sp. YAB3001 TaxID=1520812 RepID=UPI0008F68972|nr:hypothetical protein [Butyrivibrio sp. YAB3001]SFC76809.1 hypothetical protein SAMN02910398_03093 [Butyrivibrio sp. YAB3001]
MSTLECTAEEQYQVIAEENFEKGVSQGIDSITALNSWLYENGRDDDVKKATLNPKYRNKLFEEYNQALKQNK